jgi:hypothetical protein
MKAIIYAGIGLFSVASVYGVIDYYGAKKQGVLSNLYNEDAPEAPETAADVKETKNAVTTAVLKNTVAANNPAAATAKAVPAKVKKAKKEKRYVKFSDFSRGAIIREQVLAITPPPASKPEPAPVAVPAVAAEPVAAPVAAPAEKTEEKKETVTEQPVKRPAVNLEMFSRAPLKKRVKKEVPPQKVKEL